MEFSARLFLFVSAAFLAGAMLFFVPALDLDTAALFFSGGSFGWRSEAIPNFLHDIVQPSAIILSAFFLCFIVHDLLVRRGLNKPMLFMFLALIIGPGLITNTVLKDNWGRARPIQVTEFGGQETFTRPLLIGDACDNNCSFVGGDAAFGYWFHSFAYIAQRRRRMIFWAGMSVGAGYSLLRVGMGAHFLSDVFFAGVVILLTSAVLQAGIFGKAQLRARWREFLGG